MLKNFRAYEVALDMVQEVHTLLPAIKRADRNLADQISRASKAVPLQIAEAKRRTQKDRLNRFRIARGENEEVVAALEVAVRCRMLDARRTKKALAHADRVGALLYGLLR